MPDRWRNENTGGRRSIPATMTPPLRTPPTVNRNAVTFNRMKPRVSSWPKARLRPVMSARIPFVAAQIAATRPSAASKVSDPDERAVSRAI